MSLRPDITLWHEQVGDVQILLVQPPVLVEVISQRKLNVIKVPRPLVGQIRHQMSVPTQCLYQDAICIKINFLETNLNTTQFWTQLVPQPAAKTEDHACALFAVVLALTKTTQGRLHVNHVLVASTAPWAHRPVKLWMQTIVQSEWKLAEHQLFVILAQQESTTIRLVLHANFATHQIMLFQRIKHSV
jgi:hypothetical protein